MQLYFFIISLLISANMHAGSLIEANEEEVIDNTDNQLTQYFLTFPPYWEQMPDGTWSGTHYRLAQAVYKHAGLNVEFVHIPYQRMQFQIEQGKAPFINYGEVSGVNTEDILHVCVPPTLITLRVYYLKEGLEKLAQLEDFNNKNIIILHGLPLGEFQDIKQNNSINFMRPRTIESALNGLERGRGDYFITFDNLMMKAEGAYNATNKQTLKNYPLYSLLGYPIVTPKTYPNGKQLCDKVQASYQQLVKDGLVDKNNKILVSDLTNFGQ